MRLKVGPRAQRNSWVFRRSPGISWSLVLSLPGSNDRTFVLSAFLTLSFSRERLPLWNVWSPFQNISGRKQGQTGQSLYTAHCISHRARVRGSPGSRGGARGVARAVFQGSVSLVCFWKRGLHRSRSLHLLNPGKKETNFSSLSPVPSS